MPPGFLHSPLRLWQLKDGNYFALHTKLPIRFALITLAAPLWDEKWKKPSNR
jgi:hypothetical protein